MKYTSEKARRMLLQMPLVAVRFGDPDKGYSFLILLEYCREVDYSRLSSIVDGMVRWFTTPTPHGMGAQHGMDKNCVKMLLNLALSDREQSVCY